MTDIELVDQGETASNGVQSHQPDCKRCSGTSNASKTSSPTPDKAKKNNVTFREGEAQKSYKNIRIMYFTFYIYLNNPSDDVIYCRQCS